MHQLVVDVNGSMAHAWEQAWVQPDAMRTCARRSADHDAELDTLLDILLAPYLDLYEYLLIFIYTAFLVGMENVGPRGR